MGKKLTIEQFIEKAKKIHGDKYDYSKVEYVNARTKVCIICPEHGEFWTTPDSHLRIHSGCPKCVGKNKTTEEFIKDCIDIHGDKYDYSKTEYKTAFTKVCVICPEHGEFWITGDNHLRGHGCPECGGTKKYTNETFIKKSQDIHNSKYDYSKVIYKDVFTKVCIICPEHGEFWQTPHDHLRGSGCPECGKITIGDKFRKTTEGFIKESKLFFSNYYDYSKVVYKNAFTKVCIICPKHGEFWTTPDSHLHSHSGCPTCNKSKLELNISNVLKNNNINFEYQKRFKWLKYSGNLSIDFYLPDYNIAIECQGEQHYEPVKFGGISEEKAIKNFESQKLRDIEKFRLCSEHGITVVYINYNDKPELIINKIDKIK